MMTRYPATSGLIDVGTTSLYHEVRGSGPALLLITGGSGDAGEWDRVEPALAESFTVVTYDRRGASRSPRPDGWSTTSVDEQADDAAALLRALRLEPALVLGHSGGASIACAVIARHPDVVRHAIAYEPPLIAVVPDGADIVEQFTAMVDQALAAGGPRHAMEMFMRANAGDAAFEEWRASADPALLERIYANAETFFSIELPAFASFVPDLERMRGSDVPLTVVVGNDNLDTWYGAAAYWLAEGTDARLERLPGGHGGFVTHQEAFLELVQRTLRDPSRDMEASDHASVSRG
jgi:pimeloyl-ACP methyl ester carboxylesterase